MCYHLVTIYLCGHCTSPLPVLCKHIAKCDRGELAESHVKQYLSASDLNKPESILICAEPLDVNRPHFSNVVIKPYRCQGQDTNECASSDSTSWPNSALLALTAIKEQTLQLKTDLDDIIVFFSNKTGISAQNPGVDVDLACCSSNGSDMTKNSLTATLLNHQKVAETFYDVLYQYQRLTKGKDALLEKLDNAFALYFPYQRSGSHTSEKKSKDQTSHSMLKREDTARDVVPSEHRHHPGCNNRIVCQEDECVQSQTKPVQRSTVHAPVEHYTSNATKLDDQYFEEIAAATIVTLCRARSSMELLKLFTTNAKVNKPTTSSTSITQSSISANAKQGEEARTTSKSDPVPLPVLNEEPTSLAPDGQQDMLSPSTKRMSDERSPAQVHQVASAGRSGGKHENLHTAADHKTDKSSIAKTNKSCSSRSTRRKKVSFSEDVQEKSTSATGSTAVTHPYPKTVYPRKDCCNEDEVCE